MISRIFDFAASPRGAITTVFAGFGMAVGLWAGSVPLVLQTAGIGDAAFGLGIAAYTMAYVTAMFLRGALDKLASNRTILLASLPLAALACGALFLSAGPIAFFFGLAAMGIILGLIDASMNAEASQIESSLGRPVFSSFHAAASLSMAVFAITGSLLAAMGGMGAVAVVTAAGLAVAFLAVWRFLPPHRSIEIEAAELGSGFPLAPLSILGLAVGLVIAGEMTALMWSAPLLYGMSPALAALSGAGAAFFGLCMAIVRFGGDHLRARYGDIGTILGSLLLATAGFIIIGQSQHYLLSLIGFAITGFGTACIVPTLFAIAATQVPGNRAAGLGVVSLIAGIPRTLAPWVFGAFAQATSTSAAFGLCAIALAAAVGLVVLLARLKPRYA